MTIDENFENYFRELEKVETMMMHQYEEIAGSVENEKIQSILNEMKEEKQKHIEEIQELRKSLKT